MELIRRIRSVLPGGAAGTAGIRSRVVLRSLWGAVAVLWALGGIRIFLFHISTDPFNDLHVYYDAAARLNAGLPLYPPGARIYPPLFSILFRPLALLPFELAAVIWEAILLAALGLTLWRIGIRRPATWWAVLLLSIGIGWTLAIGQVEAIVALLLTIGSPFTVALAGNIKLYPLAAGIYWLARRDWQALGRLAGWTAALVLLQLILDPADTLAFPGTLAPSQVASEVSSSGNLSPFVISPVVWLVCVAIEVAVAWRFGRTRWGWAAAVGLAVLAPPRVFSYNLMTLLACLGGPDMVRADGDAGRASSPARLRLGVRRRDRDRDVCSPRTSQPTHHPR
ncbi:MAG TPA: glycosyltransferase family 87 protein [Candidatus Limnocylindrales bacterium]|nr:glycosyltransferase family 87 protein [Candidatus Limnocylindrales bacterium]